MGDSYSQYFYNFALTTSHSLLRTKAIKLAFERNLDTENRIELINFSLEQNSPLFRKLAIHLWHTQVDIDPNRLDLSKLSNTDEKELLNPETLTELRDFHVNFE